MIVLGRLLPGRSLGEVELAGSLGISRTPLREALKLLAAEGLLELRANRGAFVVPINSAGTSDLFEVVAGLEGLGATLAAARRSEASLKRLRALQRELEAQRSADEIVRYFDLNQQIHRSIVAMSGNEVLVRTHESLFVRVERVRFFALHAYGRWDESVREHREVLAALEAGDAARAGDALTRHVAKAGVRAQQLLATAPGPDRATESKRPRKNKMQEVVLP